MAITHRELIRKRQQKIRELRQGLLTKMSEDERQAVLCALYCWENLD